LPFFAFICTKLDFMKPFQLLVASLMLCSLWACGGKQQANGAADTTATAPAPEAPKERWMVLKYDDMRLRDAPSKAGAVLATYKEGTQVLDLGERSDNEEVVELRGEQIKAKWMKVRGADGKEGWIFGGALAPAPDPSVTKLQADLKQLNQSDCKSIQAGLDAYRKAMQGKSPEVADQAYVVLADFLWTVADAESADLTDRRDYDDLYSKYNPSEGDKIEAKYKAEKDAWDACGLEMRFPEGMMYLALKPGLAISTVEPFVSKTMRRYLEIRKKEEANIWMEDAGLNITPLELADRAITWDTFLEENPDFPLETTITQTRNGYQSVLIVGSDNTPAFDYTTGKLDKSWKDAWDWVLKTKPNSDTGKLLQEWNDILKADGGKRGPKAEKFLEEYWKSE
jgi:Bacterial SH3 domain